MKINNDLIIIDLEATSNQETEEERPSVQTNNFIIEIGAVHLKRDMTIGSKFSTLIKPGEPITPFIEKITGISNEMVAEAPTFENGAREFENWIRSSVGNIKNARLCAWGNYFDAPLLRKMYQNYHLKYHFSGTWFDVKTVAFMWCALSGKRTDKLSVETVANHMGIKPEGDYHRACVDAEVEAKIFQRAMNDLSGGMFIEDKATQKHRYLKTELTL